jgi:copper transport protein
MRRLVLVLAALAGGAVLFAAPASAHATLIGGTPANDARLARPPAAVTISFDEDVGLGSLAYLHVTDQAGRRVDTGAATHPDGNPRKVTVELRPGLRDATYTESFRVVSADSHPVAGVLRFVVGNGPLVTTPVAGTSSEPGVAAVFDIARWLSYGGLALLGGAWLLLTVWPAGRDERRAQRLVWSGWVGACAGAVLELLLQGPYAAGESLPSALHPGLIDATLHGDYGQLHCARLVLLGLLALLLGRALQPGAVEPVRSRRDDAYWPLMLGVAYTFAASGHAMTTSPAWLSIGADMLHLSAMAAWVGGLTVVVAAVLPRREPDELRVALPVFSRVAFLAVSALAVTGGYAAWRGVGSVRAIAHTEYGLLVAAKVLAFGGLLALGNLSRRVIQQRVRRPLVAYAMTDAALAPRPAPDLDAVSAERMRRAVLVELVVAGVVLALSAVLVSQPRGAEALAAQDRAAVSATASLGAGRIATVTVDPGEHGPVGIEVALAPGAVPQSVAATATDPADQLGPIPVRLVANGRDLYSASGVDLPEAGTWVIALVVTYSQFTAVTTDVRITLR